MAKFEIIKAMHGQRVVKVDGRQGTVGGKNNGREYF